MQNLPHTSFPAPLRLAHEKPYHHSSFSQRHHGEHHGERNLLGPSSTSHNAPSRVRPPVPPFPRREARLPPSTPTWTRVADPSPQGQAPVLISRTRICTRSVGGTHRPRVDSAPSSPELHTRPSHARRQITRGSTLTSSPSGSDDSTPRTPRSPQTQRSHLWFPPSFQSSSADRRTRHTPLTRPSLHTSRLTESASNPSFPDSRPLYPEVYSPPTPHLHSTLPQGHKSTEPFAATHTAFVHDGEAMHPLSLLHVHTTPYLNKTEQAPEVAMERICVDDAAEDDIPHSQSQPQVTSSGGLLRVMNSNAAQVIKRPASAPPVFSHPGLDSSRHDAGEETFIDNMNNLRNIRVGSCLSTTPAPSDPATQPVSATQDHEQDQARILADLAKMHGFTPRPELCPFPHSHPYLYYLFPPPPTAALITQSVVHPSLAPVIPISNITPEITGTRGRRTATSRRDGMKVGEVKGLMYENVPLIDVRTGVVHYPGAEHTSVMTGGVRIGSCAEEEREVMELLEMMEIVELEEEMKKVEREDAWRPTTPIPEQPMPHFPSAPVAPLHSRLFDHHHHHHHAWNGYAYASPPSSPACARRPTLPQFEYPQTSQQPPGIVQPLQPPIQLTSPIQHRRPSSHLANEYLPQQQQHQGTGTIEEPTPKTRRVYGYHPSFPSSFSPAVYAVSTPPPSSPAPYNAPAMMPPGYVSANSYTPQASSGPYAWFGVAMVGNASEANINMNGYGYFRPPSVAALVPPTPAAAGPSFELAPDSKNTPQVFYTTQELEAHFLRDPEFTVPPMSTLQGGPALPKRGVKRALGKQATIGLDGAISHDGGFRTFNLLEEPHPHPHPDPAPALVAAGIDRPASVPPFFEDDDDDAMTFEAEVEAGARTNRKRKRDQVVWDYRDENCSGGGGEGVSDDEVVLSADERKRARIGHGGSVRRRSFGDDKRPPGSSMRMRLAY